MNYINKCLVTYNGPTETAVDDMAQNIAKAPCGSWTWRRISRHGSQPMTKKLTIKRLMQKKNPLDIEKYNSIVEDYNDLEDNLEEGPVLDKMKALGKADFNKVGDAMDKAGEKVLVL